MLKYCLNLTCFVSYMPVSAGISYLFQKLVLKRSDLAFSFCGASNSIVKNMLIKYQQRHRSNNGAKLPVHFFLNKAQNVP